MARIDMSTALAKRRSIPRILSSSKKNSWLSPVTTNSMKEEVEGSRCSLLPTVARIKEDIESTDGGDASKSPPFLTNDNGSASPPSLRSSIDSASPPSVLTCATSTSPLTAHNSIEVEKGEPDVDEKSAKQETDEEVTDTQEIRVNPMITVRRGPEVIIPTRRIICAPTTNTIVENQDTSKLTPNELLMALVDIFAPSVDVEETPPELSREDLVFEDRPVDSMDYAPMLQRDLACASLADCTNSSFRQMYNEISSPRTLILTHPQNTQRSQPVNGPTQVSLNGNCLNSAKVEPKYAPMTLGGVIGIRRPRATTSQINNNLTLDQLNPTLAEALAAMKNKAEPTGSKPSVNGASVSCACTNANGFSNRRESLPTRMSGPVKLESLPPYNSTSQCGSSTNTSTGHLVSFNGQTTEVPEEILCHLCDYPMKLCIRKSKYKGEIREYAAYRCLRKGCQTFRSVRKVIEPEYPTPRKRKHDEKLSEAFSADGKTSSSQQVYDTWSTQAATKNTPQNSTRTSSNDEEGDSEGTLLYVPGKVTYDHLDQMQKFTITLINKFPTPSEFIARPLFAYVNMTASDIDEHLRYDEGQKKLQRILMKAPQPPIPYSLIEALEAGASVNTRPSLGSMPQITQPASNSPASTHQMAVTPPSVPDWNPPQYNTLPPNLPPPVHEAPIQQNVVGPLLGNCIPSCGMMMQARLPEVRSHQYASELIW